LASAHTDCLIQLLKSIATYDSFPGCEAAYLTLFASEVKRLFSLFFAARRGVSQLSVGQWWRIIGSFTVVTIVFFDFFSVRVFFQQNWLLRAFFILKLTF
ncbi:hypothetical protein, partial [Xenorhabdus vietnamensis]|uniref:hypothetical protein n=1 Tax=Xenorhabdus vietnamensis TaxID=351656 RepID=UPI001ABF04E2